MLLQRENAHERDAHVSFEEKAHKYTVRGDSTGFTSVTTWNHTHFAQFDETGIVEKIMKSARRRNDSSYKYYRQSAEEILAGWESNRVAASSAGTKLHNDIELFFNQEVVCNDSVEYGYFLEFWSDFQRDFPHMKPFRTEWIVYFEELKISGSIDMVFEDDRDGALWVYDWKRSKEISYECNPAFPSAFATTACIAHLPDTNFWHYSLQLNMYKTILESKYDRVVTKMCLVCLHPTNVLQSYELHEVLAMPDEMRALREVRLAELSAQQQQQQQQQQPQPQPQQHL